MPVHPARKPLARILGLTGALCVTAGCSVFPAASMPPSVVEAVHAEYAFSPGAPRIIEVPASGDDMTVLELAVEPAPRGERFERGHRIFILPYDCERADLRCRVRRWARGSEADLLAPASSALFPGAANVRFLDEPQP